MTEKITIVQNKLGLHARPCTLIVKTANKFRSEFKIIKDDTEVNGKSIMGVMTLAATKGTELTLWAHGPDEEYLISEIEHLFKTRFDEE